MRSVEKCEDLESGNRQMSHRQYSGMTYRPTAHGLSVQGLRPDSPSFLCASPQRKSRSDKGRAVQGIELSPPASTAKFRASPAWPF